MTDESTPSNARSVTFTDPDPSIASCGKEARPMIQGYDIQSELGHGGMGSVWRARQVGTERDVALKVMKDKFVRHPQAQARFKEEVKLAARLSHPNIARVYDGGIDGKAYYVMELIPGKHLDSYVCNPHIDDPPTQPHSVGNEPAVKKEPVEAHELASRDILKLMCAVCAGVEHAHQHRVVHRDLKPSNILVTKDSQPHIVDFGLAVDVLSEGTGQGWTTIGGIEGTLPYMSPEQTMPNGPAIGTRTDIYSLGVIMYRLLTDNWPYEVEGSTQEVLRTIREVQPAPPCRNGRPIKRDHEAIVLKCLKKDPKDRYQSAGELAADLQNCLTGRPVRARLPNRWYVLGRLIVYHRVVATIAFLLAVILLSSGFIGVYSLRAARTARAEGEIAAEGHQRELSENMALMSQTAFNLFLEQWHRGDAGVWQYLVSLPRNTREYQAARFLLYPESAGRERVLPDAVQDGDRLFWQFIMAERLLKNGDRTGAQKAYQQCLAEAEGSGEWFVGKIRMRLTELQTGK